MPPSNATETKGAGASSSSAAEEETARKETPEPDDMGAPEGSKRRTHEITTQVAKRQKVVNIVEISDQVRETRSKKASDRLGQDEPESSQEDREKTKKKKELQHQERAVWTELKKAKIEVPEGLEEKLQLLEKVNSDLNQEVKRMKEEQQKMEKDFAEMKDTVDRSVENQAKAIQLSDLMQVKEHEIASELWGDLKKQVEQYNNDHWKEKVETARRQIEEGETTSLEDIVMILDLREMFSNSRLRGYQSQTDQMERVNRELTLANSNLEAELNKLKDEREAESREYQLQLQQRRNEYVQLQARTQNEADVLAKEWQLRVETEKAKMKSHYENIIQTAQEEHMLTMEAANVRHSVEVQFYKSLVANMMREVDGQNVLHPALARWDNSPTTTARADWDTERKQIMDVAKKIKQLHKAEKLRDKLKDEVQRSGRENMVLAAHQKRWEDRAA
ncbi:hypothetical protein R1sor_010187 [Riccia sorocarpa]|uniref:Uncharacterized protein n=1 Tax=Riccia sorocarpa TaxID=122646 RepID=A0ABD3HYV2_9MARC